MAEHGAGDDRLAGGPRQVTTWLGIAGTVLGLLGTGVGIWSQYQARQQQTRLDEARLLGEQQQREIALLQAEIARIASQREDRKLDYEIAVKIYDKVSTIGQEDARQLRMAAALVEILPDGAFKGRLATAVAALSSSIAVSTDDQELKKDARLVAQAADFIAQAPVPRLQALSPAVGGEPVGSGSGSPEPAPSVGEGSTGGSSSTWQGQPSGWDYDVFWCEAMGKPLEAHDNQRLAEAVARALQTPGAGRVRVRMLPDVVNARPGYQVSGKVVRADVDPVETKQARTILPVIDAAGGPFRIEGNDSASPWFISVYVCL